MVEFCSDCGAIVIGKKGEKVACPSCGKTKKAAGSVNFSERIKKEKKEIVNTEESIEIYPIIKEVCPKCKNKKAYYWTQQMRAGDEPETMFFKCTKCKHKWREYR